MWAPCGTQTCNLDPKLVLTITTHPFQTEFKVKTVDSVGLGWSELCHFLHALMLGLVLSVCLFICLSHTCWINPPHVKPGSFASNAFPGNLLWEAEVQQHENGQTLLIEAISSVSSHLLSLHEICLRRVQSVCHSFVRDQHWVCSSTIYFLLLQTLPNIWLHVWLDGDLLCQARFMLDYYLFELCI